MLVMMRVETERLKARLVTLLSSTSYVWFSLHDVSALTVSIRLSSYEPSVITLKHLGYVISDLMRNRVRDAALSSFALSPNI